MNVARSRIVISSPLPRFTGSLESYFSAASRIPSAASSTYRNSRVGEPSPHSSTSRVAALPRRHALADHRRDHVRRLQIEVVARPVEVHREQHDAVHAVLLAIGLRLRQHHLLGEAVGRVGLLGVAVPEVVFAERDGRELRVRADRAGRHQLGDAREAASSKSCAPIMSVLEQEPARGCRGWRRCRPPRRQVNHQVGARVGEQARARRPDRPGRSRASGARRPTRRRLAGARRRTCRRSRRRR